MKNDVTAKAVVDAINEADAALERAGLPTVRTLLASFNRVLECPDINLDSLEDETIEAVQEVELLRGRFLFEKADLNPNTALVTWHIDIEEPGATAEEIARKALEIQRDPESIATVFEVRIGGRYAPMVSVDITALDEVEDYDERVLEP